MRWTTYHVTGETNFSGGEGQMFLLAERLRVRGHRAVVVAPPGSAAAAEADRNGFEKREIAVRNDLDLLAGARLRSLLRRERPDVVHFHSMRAHVVGAFAARGARVPCVVATRRMDYAIARHPWNRLAYGRFTDRVIAISEAVRAALVRFGLAAERIRLVRSGVDASRFDPDADRRAARSRAGLPDAPLLVLCVGHLHPRKDHRTLIRAFAAAAGTRTDARLLLVGEGPEREALERLASSLGREGIVLFLGRRSDVADLLAACDLFAISPRQEGLGIAVLEAMAAGRPVVATRAGGLAESVVPGETGLLVPPNDEAALASALGRLLADPALRDRMGRAGRARVEREFSADAMVEGTERVYAEVLAR